MADNEQLKGKAISNMIWRLAERTGAQGVAFVVSIVLARFLAPDAYGTVALLMVFTTILTGVDIIDATIDISLGQHVDLNIEESDQLIVNEYLYCNDGIYDHLEGFPELEKDGIIDNYFEFKDPGTPMDGANSSGDRIASFTIVDNDLERLKKRHAMALKMVKAISVEGLDILNHEISYPLFTE